jgi:RNA recognition motif-containing protein
MHIFIENLPDDVTEESLRELFDDFLKPAQPEIKIEYVDGHPSFATLTLPELTQQTATVLAQHFNQHWFGGKLLHVHATQFE